MSDISTGTYLSEIAPQQFFQEDLCSIDYFVRAILNHPTTVKVIEIALFIFGTGLIAILPYTIPELGKVCALSLACLGGLIILITYLFHETLELLPPYFDMSTHLYQPFTSRDSNGTQLYYENDIPILVINADNPYQAGYDHGYHLGIGISKMLEIWDPLLHDKYGYPRAEEIPKSIKAFCSIIPKAHLEELQGLVKGYNQWIDEQNNHLHIKLSFESALVFHFVSDIMHYKPSDDHIPARSPITIRINDLQRVGCTVVVDRDENQNIVAARNMDWGLVGAYTVIFKRKYANFETLEIGFPGLIGTVTGRKDSGFTVMMNIAFGQTSEVRGMPTCFFNRACLENCNSVSEVENFLKKYNPLGPFHLIAIDNQDAKSFHMHQNADEQSPHYVTRSLFDQQPLIVTNCAYPDHTGRGEDFVGSHLREESLEAFFRDARKKIAKDKYDPLAILGAAMKLPHVCNPITAQSILFSKDKVELVFDNYFAAEKPLHLLKV